MHYRVEELAAAVSVGVDTVRFYQGRGLLPPPRREGRLAVYGESHLERLRRIRALQAQGFTLAQIRRVLTGDADDAVGGASEPLLAALVEASVGERTLSRAELATEAGLPEALIGAILTAGLIVPLQVDGEERFSEADLEMARAGMVLLDAGFPLQTLLAHAVDHAQHVQELVDTAIDLFDDHVRKTGPAAGDTEAITQSFRTLLALATRLVAVHFQRTLVTRALNRLRGKDELKALEAALEATEAARLEVEVAWKS
jgi:DNA-binding transcriptional MerR regulator